jgi:hypothetical protein
MLKILEYAWLAIGLIGICMGAYKTYTDGISESYLFFIIALVAGVFYSIRRKQRLDNEAGK